MRTPALGLLCAALLAPTAWADARPVRVAYVDLVAMDKSARDGTAVVNTTVAAEVTRGGRTLISGEQVRADADTVAALQGCPSEACRAAAERLGADYVLLAAAAQLGREFALELKLVEVKKGLVVATQADVASRPRDIGPLTQKSLAALFASVPQTVEELKQPVLTAAVTPEPPVEPLAPMNTTPPTAVKKAGPSRLPAYATLGGGAAAVVVGAVLVGTALNWNQNKTQLTYSEAAAARNGARTRLFAGYGLVAAGVAAAGAGVYLLLKPDAPPVALVPTADGAVLTLSGRF